MNIFKNKDWMIGWAISQVFISAILFSLYLMQCRPDKIFFYIIVGYPFTFLFTVFLSTLMRRHTDRGGS